MTAILRRLRARQPHLEVIIALLCLVFGVTAWLAYEAAATAREAEQSAEDTLENYALMAADVVVENAQQLAFETWKRLFVRVVETESAGMTPDRIIAQLDYPHFCGCDPKLVGRSFWIDLETAGQSSQDVPVDAIARAASDTRNAAFSAGWSLGSSFVDSTRVAIFAVRDGPQGRPGFAYGLLADAAVLIPFFSWAGLQRPLLPHRHVQDRNLDFLGVTVRSAVGRNILVHGAEPLHALAGSARVPSVLPPLDVIVEIDRDAADVLLFGGMPRSRLPFLLALLTMTGALLSAAFVLLRRETELTRLRGEFVASVSHELRTPLAQIRMFAETLMLGRTRSDTERRKALEVIDQEARRLSSLVENVLLFAKSERRSVSLRREPVPLGVEIGQAIDSFAPFCRSRDVRVRAELEHGVIAPVDRYALRQILVNLLDNALKYGPAGQEITVGLAVFGDAARVWVDDEGPGIPPVSRERVFDPFFRVERSQERAIAGSGIGLAVVRELAELHGGRAWTEDAPGGGSRFAVQFPGATIAAAEPIAGAVA